MKKIILILAAGLLSMSSLFAWDNIIILGAHGGVPTELEGGKDSEYKLKLQNGGLCFGYTGVFDCGLALRNTLYFGAGSVSEKNLDKIDNIALKPMSVSYSDIIGVGYTPVKTNNFILGVFGTIGSSTEAAIWADENKKEDSAWFSSYYTKSFLIGTEALAVYTPNEVFSIYGSLSVNAAMGSLYSYTASKIGDKEDDNTDEHNLKPYTKILPSIGIAWRF